MSISKLFILLSCVLQHLQTIHFFELIIYYCLFIYYRLFTVAEFSYVLSPVFVPEIELLVHFQHFQGFFFTCLALCIVRESFELGELFFGGLGDLPAKKSFFPFTVFFFFRVGKRYAEI